MVVGGGTEGLNVFMPDWWLQKPKEPLDNPQPDTGHYPYARPVRGSWKKQSDGTWKSTVEDTHKWEVICEQCGDGGGPLDVQPDSAKELRGPYASKHKATHVAKKHFESFRST